MNLVTCRCGCVYAATNFDTCPDCGLQGAKAAITPTKPSPSAKRAKTQSTRQKRLSLSQRLTVAGLTSDTAIRNAIATGALVTALYHTVGDTGEPVFREYRELVGRVGTPEQILTYQYRLVSYNVCVNADEVRF